MNNVERCPHCNNFIYRVEGVNYCSRCGTKLPPMQMTEQKCPYCDGTGKIKRSPYQGPLQPYFGEVAINDVAPTLQNKLTDQEAKG